MLKWNLGCIHPVYGEVVMVMKFSLDEYRFFLKGDVVSMIPLSALEEENEPTHPADDELAAD